MGYIISSVLIIIAFIDYRKERSFGAPIVFFCLLWALICFFASLRLFTLYEVRVTTWFIILIGSFSFVGGSVFGRKIKIKYNDDTVLANQLDDVILVSPKLVKLFYIMMIVLFLLSFHTLIECVKLLSQNVSISLIRAASDGDITLSGFTGSSGFRYYINSVISPTIKLFAVPLGILIFLTDMRKQKKAIILVLLYEIVCALISGGRFAFAYLVIEFFVCYELIHQKINLSFKLNKKMKKILFSIGAVAIAAIVIVSNSRAIKADEFLEHMYIYFCGDVVLLDQKLMIFTNSNFYAYGFASFYGFWSLFFTVLSPVFGGSLPQFWNDVVNNVMNGQNTLQIGSSISMNAFVTPYYYLYADFGVIGIVLGMFFFGALCGYVYKKAKFQNDLTGIIWYMIFSQMIFKTLHTYPFVSQVYALAIVVFMLRKVSLRRR